VFDICTNSWHDPNKGWLPGAHSTSSFRLIVNVLSATGKCCDPRADPVDTGRVLVRMLDHAASSLTDPKQQRISFVVLLLLNCTRQADPSHLALILM
jgi:hypothetical protein